MVGSRVGEWGDLLADALGTAVGIAGADLLRRICGRSKPGSAQAQALGR
jgi:hypothetical protein